MGTFQHYSIQHQNKTDIIKGKQEKSQKIKERRAEVLSYNSENIT